MTIQAQVLEVLDTLRREADLGLILVSHDLAVISQTCSRVYVMYAGRVVESAEIRNLLRDPRHPYTFALLRSVPDPDAPVHRLLTIPGQPPDLTDVPRGCTLRPSMPVRRGRPARRTRPTRRWCCCPPGTDHSTACIRWQTAGEWDALVDPVPAGGAG